MDDPLKPEDHGDRTVALTAYALGELEGEEKARVTQWLRGDDAARKEVAQIQAMADRLHAEFFAADSPGLTEEQKAAILARPEPGEEKIVRPLRWIRPLCALGVAASLLVFAGVALLQQFGNPMGKTGAGMVQEASEEERLAEEKAFDHLEPAPALAPRMAPPEPAADTDLRADGAGSRRSLGSLEERAEQEDLEIMRKDSAELAAADAVEPSAPVQPGIAEPGVAVEAAAEEAEIIALSLQGADREAVGRAVGRGRPPATRSRAVLGVDAGVDGVTALGAATVVGVQDGSAVEFWPVPPGPFAVPLSTSTASFDSLRAAVLDGAPLPSVDWRASDFISAAAQAAGPVSGDVAEVRLRSAQSPGPAATWLVSVAARLPADLTAGAAVQRANLHFQVDPSKIQGLRILGYDRIAGEAGARAEAEGEGTLEPGKWAGLFMELLPHLDPAAGAAGAGEAAGRPWLSVSLLQSGEAETGRRRADGMLTERPGPWLEADPVLRAQAAAAALGTALEQGEEVSDEQAQQWKDWVPGSGGGSVAGDLREMLRAYPAPPSEDP